MLEEGAFLQLAGLVEDFQADGIQVGLLGGPEVRAADFYPVALPHFHAVLVIQDDIDTAAGLDNSMQRSNAQVFIEGRLGADVAHMALRAGH